MKTLNARWTWSLLPLLFLGMFACREDVAVTPESPSPDQPGTLLNSSFELGGGSTLLGWTPSNSQLTDFNTDTPPGGGTWSLAISSTPGPAAYIQALFPAGSGTSAYRLSVWGKYLRTPGTISIIQKTQSGTTIRFTAPVQDTVWNSYQLLDTLSTNVTDSVGVRLSGGITEVTTGIVIFDLCLFERL